MKTEQIEDLRKYLESALSSSASDLEHEEVEYLLKLIKQERLWTVDEIIEELKDIDSFDAAEYFFDRYSGWQTVTQNANKMEAGFKSMDLPVFLEEFKPLASEKLLRKIWHYGNVQYNKGMPKTEKIKS